MAQPSSLQLAPGVLIRNKYRLIRLLGEGSMGSVWAARNEITTGEFALKLIARAEPELRCRLLREARVLGSLKHQNIIDIFDVAETETGDPFIIMQLLTGETAADLLTRRRRLDPSTAASIGCAVGRALAAAHAKSIIHRDIKPANIFLHHDPDEAMIVKVLDFGVAKNLAAPDSHQTAFGGIVGSPFYMSPEQVRADGDIDHRTDIWTLGVSMFEMLTGVRPFNGNTQEVFSQILRGDIPTVDRYLRYIDPRLVDVVAGCMRRNRDERFQSATEVAEALNMHIAASAEAPASRPVFARIGGGTLRMNPDEVASTRKQVSDSRGVAPAPDASVSRAAADADGPRSMPSTPSGATTTTPLTTNSGAVQQSGTPLLDTERAIDTKDRRGRTWVHVAVAGTIACWLGAIGMLLLLLDRSEPTPSLAAPSLPIPKLPTPPVDTPQPLVPPSAADSAGGDLTTPPKPSPMPETPSGAQQIDMDHEPRAPEVPAAPILRPRNQPAKAAANPCAGKTAFLLRECERKHRDIYDSPSR